MIYSTVRLVCLPVINQHDYNKQHLLIAADVFQPWAHRTIAAFADLRVAIYIHNANIAQNVSRNTLEALKKLNAYLVVRVITGRE